MSFVHHSSFTGQRFDRVRRVRRVQRVRRVRRGATLLWSLAALGLALALTPLYVSLCGTLSRLSARSAHRLHATQRGVAVLERLRAAPENPAPGGWFVVPELPGGRGCVTWGPTRDRRLREVRVEIVWTEGSATGRAEWTTLAAHR